MIIDFHTHMFPDKIAARTIDFLSKTGGDMNPFTDGTWKGLKESTKQAGIDRFYRASDCNQTRSVSYNQ